jgi:DNA-binding MarR family transcriptional regulator/N-acetylglutamate synthase-like GNAT family acetyltransferase
MAAMADTLATAEGVRRFNRFYTRLLGLLDEGLLKSEFSLTEARVLYELAQREATTARQLGGELMLDAGYLSRLLKKFEARGLISRASSDADGRAVLLRLTDAGRAAFVPLNEASREQAANLVAHLDADRQNALLQAMQTITALLAPAAAPAVPYLLRPLQVGDIGWIVHRQGLYYARELGFDESFEALVAEIAAGFVKNLDVRRERAWIAERNGQVAGSVFLMRESDEVARLRLLYVEPAARGLGIGGRLVDESVRFARAKGYASVTLWTNAQLLAARRIYEAAGFKLIAEERSQKFGGDFHGQTWMMAL